MFSFPVSISHETLVVSRSRLGLAPSTVTKTSPCWYGDIVPGSTFKYGSHLRTLTLSPLALSRQHTEAAVIPFPERRNNSACNKNVLRHLMSLSIFRMSDGTSTPKESLSDITTLTSAFLRILSCSSCSAFSSLVWPQSANLSRKPLR